MKSCPGRRYRIAAYPCGKILKKGEVTMNTKWISVTEQMPKPDETVWFARFTYAEGGYVSAIKGYCDHGGEWHYVTGEIIGGTAIGWSRTNVNVYDFADTGLNLPSIPVVEQG